MRIESRRQFLGAAAASALAIAASDLSSLATEDSTSEYAWFNEPKHWRRDGNALICTAGPKTDFWRKTFYGYTTDNGHVYYRQVRGDFTCEVKITGQYRDQYDQAGIMLRSDQNTWMKCGVEFVDSHQNMSVVITREFSDWSTARLPENNGPLWLRVVRKGPAVDIFHSLHGKDYMESRLGYLGPADPMMVGLMCAAPEGNGFEVRFDDWKIT
jgi:regulation of enolase protein 1 (concanavalin A-like superfamily)